ncbi:MAG TPA: fluoride efflux transporter CrcB [Vicinamibacteria bacterium]|nr:fluoride efflux transporter CrcB [Vicinamibacteria bacterium]
MSARFIPYLLVGVGGFIGANARYVVARWADNLGEARFPWGTFLINVGGSFLLGLLGAVLAEKAVAHGDALRLALGVGFLGAFTTFSTFELETHALLEDGVWLGALANMVASLVLGLVAVRLGVLAGKAWL